MPRIRFKIVCKASADVTIGGHLKINFQRLSAKFESRTENGIYNC